MSTHLNADDTVRRFGAFAKSRGHTTEEIIVMIKLEENEHRWPAVRAKLLASESPAVRPLLEAFEQYLKDELRKAEERARSEEIPKAITEGLNAYLFRLVDELRKVALQGQGLGERENRYYTLLEKNDEGRNASLVTLGDPFSDFKLAEKREIELEKYYENKMLNNRSKEEQALEKEKEDRPDPPPDDKRKKNEFNEDHEVLKTLSKIKMEKSKETNSLEKQGQEQNKTIEMFLKNTESQAAEGEVLAKRERMGGSAPASATRGLYVENKHLIHFLENDRYFRKSKFLLKAYFNRAVNKASE